ncbi:MAG: ATP-dependent helicase [Anaerovoracaceae bacterium]|jgi:DNA helicase-2/ATP-dependent DNA helicase PcrA
MDSEVKFDLLEDLNDSQRAAVTATEGPVRVVAGAGSGKTRALVRRFAYLVLEAGIPPENILCVTFTNKAAGEMRQRIHRLIGDNDTGYINTFHGFCANVLKEDSHAVQYPKSFIVLDNADIDQMLDVIYKERGLTLRDMSFRQARDMIEMEKIKNRPTYYLDLLDLSLDALQNKYQEAQTASDIIFYGYLYEEKKCFGLDYNDLIKVTLYIFEQREEIRLKWQQRLAYIMIDEFQDIDELQFRLMRVLADYHRNLFVVGDPDQTIYSWRGASGRFLMDFDQSFPGTKTIMMMENYRSGEQIIAGVNALIRKNKNRIQKDLIATRGPGLPIRCQCAKSPAAEAQWICDEIIKLTEQGVPLHDVAVFYRAHYITRSLEEAFLQRELPYTIYSGVQFFERLEIKDALAYLRMIACRDDLSFLRIVNRPRRSIGRKRIAFLTEYAAQRQISLCEALSRNLEHELFRGTGAGEFVRLIRELSGSAAGRSVSEILTEVLERSGYEKMLRTEGAQDRLDNLAELKQSVREFEQNCGEECDLDYYLTQAALFSNSDTADHRDRVKLMTIHAAKGLEFPYVFLCAMNEGILPSRNTRTRARMEEERRLAFVAMTRAEKGLFLSAAQGAHHDGSPRVLSRFLLDIDSDLVVWEQAPGEAMIKASRRDIAFRDRRLAVREEGPAFQRGDRVRHMIFGEGTVELADEDKRVYQIRFDELPTARRIAFTAKLERIKP